MKYLRRKEVAMATTAERFDVREHTSDQAEQSVLGGLMLDSQAFWKIAGKISVDDFFRAEHKKLWNCITKLIQGGHEADIVTVHENMDGEVDFQYLASIANHTPGSSNILAYAQIVRDRANKRRGLLTFSNAIEQLNNGDELDDVVAGAMQSLQNISHSGSLDVTFSQAIDQAQASAEKAMELRLSGAFRGISTTLPFLNRLTGGFHGPKMIVLGGRPGTYKSAFALQILLRAARKQIPVGICSLEMSANEIASRSIAHVLKIDGHEYSKGDPIIVRETKQKLSDEFKNIPLFIDHHSFRLNEILARIVEWKYKYDIQLACIDHIQLVQSVKAGNRFQELSEVSRQVKLLAMKLEIPILLLSQISREVEKENREPRLSDLRECGNIEQDADIVMFMHCQKNDDGFGQASDKYSLLLAKQRDGSARQFIDLVVNGQNYFIGELGR
jgi:replicative DNA helicase